MDKICCIGILIIDKVHKKNMLRHYPGYFAGEIGVYNIFIENENDY